MKGKLGFFAKLAFFAVLCFLFIVMVQINIQINELKIREAEVQKRLYIQQEAVAKVQAELDAPYSEETIRRIAKNDLNLCDPGDIIYESDLPN